MASELINTSHILNGYFYTFNYEPAMQTRDVDRSPLIYCIGSDAKNHNNFIGINFHRFNSTINTKIMKCFQSKYQYFERDERIVVPENILITFFSNIRYGVRQYNRKRVFNCYRIPGKAILRCMSIPEELIIGNNDELNMQRELQTGTNKGF